MCKDNMPIEIDKVEGVDPYLSTLGILNSEHENR
jgi:hypothetical protein